MIWEKWILLGQFFMIWWFYSSLTRRIMLFIMWWENFLNKTRIINTSFLWSPQKKCMYRYVGLFARRRLWKLTARGEGGKWKSAARAVVYYSTRHDFTWTMVGSLPASPASAWKGARCNRLHPFSLWGRPFCVKRTYKEGICFLWRTSSWMTPTYIV